MEKGRYDISKVFNTAYWGFLGVGTTFDIFQNILFLYGLNTAYWSFLDKAYWILFPSFSLVKCRNRYAISFLMDTAYWLSEHFWEDVEQGNGQEDESAPNDEQFFYDDEGINIAYETKYNVHSSKDSSTHEDNDDEDFLVDKENENVELDVDVNLLGISMDVPFNNIGVTNLVPDDVLEGEDVDVINADRFDSDNGNDDETSNYRRRRLTELSREIEGVINASGQWKYSFYTGQNFTTAKEAKDIVYLHSIKSRRNLKLYKNDSVRIRARCDGKVHVFTMSQVRVNLEILVKAVQDQLQHDLEVQISMSKAFREAEREIRGDYVLQYSMLRDYVVELQSTNPNTTVKIAVERNTDPSLPTRVFQRIYVCLGALKMGFRACKRDLVGLDSAFMKGPFPGQVLAAFGLDSNNGIYPLAYALVKAEKHRYWLRHIHENMKQGWCGQAYKDLLWRSASATSVKEFKKYMLELKKMNPKAHKWLNKIPPEHWVRYHFSGRAKSDLLLNNICEVFNGKIIGGGTTPRSMGKSLLLVDYIEGNILSQGRPKKIRKRSKHEDEPFVKDGKLSKKGRTISCQSCGNIGHNKVTCKGQGRKATTGGNNAEASGSASRQAQQTESAVGQDGSGGSGVGAVIDFFAADGQGGVGVGVGSQGSSYTRWTKTRVQTERISLQKTTLTQPASQPSTNSQVPVTETINVDRRGIPTQSSAAGGVSECPRMKKGENGREKNSNGKKSLFDIDLTNAFNLEKGTESMKDNVSQEHVCKEEVPLNNNIGKESGDIVEMPSEAVE
ncbi:hypothetical protein Tco_0535656 [Tanacetum coccineum]